MSEILKKLWKLIISNTYQMFTSYAKSMYTNIDPTEGMEKLEYTSLNIQKN